jgi:hypothetical protein
VLSRIICSLAVLLVISVQASAQSGSAEIPEQSTPGRLAIAGLVAKKPYEPITGRQRVHWFVRSTAGPESVVAGVLSAGISTATDEPREYGPSWGGFGRRYGIRFTGISTGNAIEAGLGAIWGEDPRYDRAAEGPFGGRVWNAIKLTFVARYPDGHLAPAYARLIAVPGNNLLSNTWRAESETHAGDIAMRTMLGILGRMGANAFVEFWPDVHRRIFRRRTTANAERCGNSVWISDAVLAAQAGVPAPPPAN